MSTRDGILRMLAWPDVGKLAPRERQRACCDQGNASRIFMHSSLSYCSFSSRSPPMYALCRQRSRGGMVILKSLTAFRSKWVWTVCRPWSSVASFAPRCDSVTAFSKIHRTVCGCGANTTKKKNEIQAQGSKKVALPSGRCYPRG